MRRNCLWFAVALFVNAHAGASLAGEARPYSIPRIPDRDRIRLAEAFRLADAVQDKVWPQWSTAPFALLLVTPDAEFLVRHPAPTPDFTPGAYDSLLQSPVYWRKRVFPVTFQATFPAVGGVSTIVIGQGESAQPKQNSTRWLLTVLHEHFHQWQESRPGHAEGVRDLGLARGDSTGMWMLNFPFPYDDSLVARAFDDLCRLRVEALRARSAAGFRAAYRVCDDARRRFSGLLAPDDARYLKFQLWKEGVARYTEYDVARVAAASYRPSARYASLDDFTSFETESRTLRDQILDEQSSLRLSEWRRIAVYSTGAADALQLDRVRPGWKREYARARFSLDRLFPPAGR